MSQNFEHYLDKVLGLILGRKKCLLNCTPEHSPPRGPEVAEHAVVVGEDAEGDEQDEVAEYEEAPEEPVDHVVSQHLQEEGRADDGEHDVGAVGDVWVPVVSNETKDWFIGALLSSKSY